MSEDHFDRFEHFNFDMDKHLFSGRSGRLRTKQEAALHTNRFDPSGHSRKLVTKMRNTEIRKRADKK
uniref:Nuclear protein 1 n=1 Tax=Artemia sinica TaxID=112780 RepID=G3M4F5_9CRUS|nr:nuclear protein 1 [Artemia sinica]